MPADQLTPRPPAVSWEQTGSLYVAGGTAHGMTDAVGTDSGETAVVFGATGGVGSILTQLLVNDGVRVLAVAGPANDTWVRSVGAEPVHHGEGLGQRLREAAPGASMLPTTPSAAGTSISSPGLASLLTG